MVNEHEESINITTLIRLLDNLQNGRQSTSTEHTSNSSSNINLQFDAYNENEESFLIYKQRLQKFLDLRGIVDDVKKVQVLINCIGTKHYQLLASLTAPNLPNTGTYEELTDILEKHLCPKPNEITEQHKFLLRMQNEGESLSTYVAELKRLSVFCNYTCAACKKNTAETHLRSQFIRGIQDADIRQRLLEESGKKLTLEEILQCAFAIEASKIESREMHEVRQVNSVASSKTNKSYKNRNESNATNIDKRNTVVKCFRCGLDGHKSNKCKSEMKIYCHYCKSSNHNTIVCFKKPKSADANEIEVINDNNLQEINSIKVSGARGKYFISLQINNNPIDMELDTGAAISTMGKRMFREKLPSVEIQPTDMKLKTYKWKHFLCAWCCKSYN